MKDETLLPCPFCGATQDGIEFAETSSGEFCVCCDECSSTGPVRVSKELAIESWNRRALQSGNSEAIQDFLRVLDEYPEQLVPINRNSAVVRALRNATVGNSAQHEPVSQTYKLLPNSFTDDELMGMAHGDNPVSNAYRELLEFRHKAAGGNSSQPVMTSSKLESGENC
jgi:Lar family restriction alleviation protein